MAYDESSHLSCAGSSPTQYLDTRKLSWKARARSHNSGLDDPLSRAFSTHASFPESADASMSGQTPADPEASGAAPSKAPLRWSSSSERLSSVTASRKSFIGSVLLWSCLALAGMVAVSLLSPARDISHLRLRITRNVQEDGRLGTLGVSLAPAADTLIIYTYSNSDPEYERNLHFFVKHSLSEGDSCDYVFIVQQSKELFGSSQLPQLPRNARYIFHENRCYDWGTFGWALAERKVDTSRYTYIIFMNSSVRGPFLPAFWPARVHWSHVLTTRINSKVKLVGPTISCEPAWQGGNMSSEKRQVPHVQSYAIATDQVGLDVLVRDGRVFECFENIKDTIFHAELGASHAVLAANFSIDSLMLRYQGIDWTDTANWNCNAGLNPYAEHTYDGVPLNPLEVMFVKVKDFQLEADWMSTHLAVTYSRWLDSQGTPGAINSNDFAEHRAAYKLAMVLIMQHRGSACFDSDFYRSRSHDMPDWPASRLWEHFVHNGQFEGRPFRFTCENPLHNEAVAVAIMHTSAQNMERLLAAAAEAAKAAAKPAEAAAVAAAAAVLTAASPMLPLVDAPPATPAADSVGESGPAQASPDAQADASALRRLLMA